MEARIEGSNLILVVPLNNPPKQSSSGKTLLIAGGSGNIKTDLMHDGKQVTIGLNAFIPARS